MNRGCALALLLAFATALLLRCPQLGLRPLHNDEGVNAVKLTTLWERGEYRYDPHEYHGPALHYFSLPALWLSPAQTSADLTDARLRVVTVCFGVALILLLPLLFDGLGRLATAWTGWFVAVSPAMVFYSRYFIHEMLLIFFTLLTLAAGWRYARTRHPAWLALVGAGVGLMFATKETFVLTLAALGFALVAARFWSGWRARRLSVASGAAPQSASRQKWIPPLQHLGLGIAAGGLVWLLFFSSFFTNWAGLADSFKTYLPWLSRAGGDSPHIHPWHFYWERLLWFHPEKSPVWTEVLIALLAVVGAAAGFLSNKTIPVRADLARFLAFYTLAVAGIYTVIPYKTTWCLLNFWLGTVLLAGIGAALLLQFCRTRTTKICLGLLLGVGAGHLALQAWLLSRGLAADLRNPYVYAQTSPHIRELVARIHAIARVAPDGFDIPVKVAAPESYWPLPWYLREFSRIGWWEELPSDPYAPIVITSARLGAALDDKSDKRWLMTGYYELRPNIFVELYVERGLWEKFVATLPRDSD